MTGSFRRKSVFLDTEVFTREAFNFGSVKLSEVKRLGSQELIQIVMPATTIKECKRHIEKMVRSARSFVKKSESQYILGILKQSDIDCTLLGRLDASALTSQIHTRFDEYIRASKVVVCDAASVTVEALMDAYFAGLPPFGADQKKDQFPDAVAVMALNCWLAENPGPLHVVSGDGDMRAATRLIGQATVHQELGSFLDAYNKDASAQANFVMMALARHRSDIEDAVKMSFCSLGFLLNDDLGEVEDVIVSNASLRKAAIVSLHDECAIVECVAEITFSATVTYEDFSSGYYDHEDNRHYGAEKRVESVQRIMGFPLEVEIGWDGEGVTEVNARSDVRDIEVSLHQPKARSLSIFNGGQRAWSVLSHREG